MTRLIKFNKSDCLDLYKILLQTEVAQSREVICVDTRYVIESCKLGRTDLIVKIIDYDNKVLVDTCLPRYDQSCWHYSNNSIDNCFILAIRAGNLSTIEFLIKLGANNFKHGLRVAIADANAGVVHFIVQHMDPHIINDVFTKINIVANRSMALELLKTGKVTDLYGWFSIIDSSGVIYTEEARVIAQYPREYIPRFPKYLCKNIVRAFGEHGCDRKRLAGKNTDQIFRDWDYNIHEMRSVLENSLPEVLAMIVAEYMP